MLKLIVHADGGHSWLAVKRQLLINLNILDKISSCSYQRGGTVYLEEDIDAGIFIDAYLDKEWSGIVKPENRQELLKRTFWFKNSYRDYSPIRKYDQFNKFT
jgi:hypothetical protein